MIPVLDFWEDLSIVALVLDFFMLYKLLGYNFIFNKFVALLVALLVTWLLVVPYVWVRWFVLFCMVLYTFPYDLNDKFDSWWPGPIEKSHSKDR